MCISFLTACTSASNTSQPVTEKNDLSELDPNACYYPDTTQQAPNWVCGDFTKLGEPGNSELFAVGKARKMMGGARSSFVQRQQALAKARTNLLEKLRQKTEGEVQGQITDEVLRYLKAPNGDMYALIKGGLTPSNTAD